MPALQSCHCHFRSDILFSLALPLSLFVSLPPSEPPSLLLTPPETAARMKQGQREPGSAVKDGKEQEEEEE